MDKKNEIIMLVSLCIMVLFLESAILMVIINNILPWLIGASFYVTFGKAILLDLFIIIWQSIHKINIKIDN